MLVRNNADLGLRIAVAQRNRGLNTGNAVADDDIVQGKSSGAGKSATATADQGSDQDKPEPRNPVSALPVLRLARMSLVALWFALVSALFVATAGEPQGVLKVKSSVAGAEVYFDGALLGTVPVTKYVAVGPHKVRVVADNFDPYVRTVNIEADRTTDLSATLVAGSGTIEFAGPKGGAVTVAGSRYTLPSRIPSPGAGDLTWTAEAPGFEPGTGTLAVVKGRNHLVEVTLESNLNVISITSKPAGATVALDGAPVGVTPLRLANIPSGTHAVEVRADGYATAYRRADNVDGAKVTLDLVLGKSGAALAIAGLGTESVVRLNGVEVGRGATIKLDRVERGKAVIEIIEGEHITTAKVDIPAEGAVSYRLLGGKLVEQKPLTSQWGFWAAVGGGAVVAGGTAAAIAVANQPEPPPAGEVVVELP